MRKFTMFDIHDLQEAMKGSSVANDVLKRFLKKFDFDDVYTTLDESIVYESNGFSIEFFDFENPIKRKGSVFFIANGTYQIIEL